MRCVAHPKKARNTVMSVTKRSQPVFYRKSCTVYTVGFRCLCCCLITFRDYTQERCIQYNALTYTLDCIIYVYTTYQVLDNILSGIPQLYSLFVICLFYNMQFTYTGKVYTPTPEIRPEDCVYACITVSIPGYTVITEYQMCCSYIGIHPTGSSNTYNVRTPFLVHLVLYYYKQTKNKMQEYITYTNLNGRAS